MEEKKQEQLSTHKEQFLVVNVPPSEQGRELIRFLEEALKTHDLPFFKNAKHPNAGAIQASSVVEGGNITAHLSEPAASASGTSGDGRALLMLVRQEGWPPPPPPGS